jgi:hypothetical protein
MSAKRLLPATRQFVCRISPSYGEGEGLILIDIPPQPDELKSFLVHGAIVDGKIEGRSMPCATSSLAEVITTTPIRSPSCADAGRKQLREKALELAVLLGCWTTG